MLLVSISPSSCSGACANNNIFNVNPILTGAVSEINPRFHILVFSPRLLLSTVGSQTVFSARPYPDDLDRLFSITEDDFEPESQEQAKSAVDSCTDDISEELKLTSGSCYNRSRLHCDSVPINDTSATVDACHLLVTFMARVKGS